VIIPHKVDEKFSLKTGEMERGESRGCSPRAASPIGGERGSLS